MNVPEGGLLKIDAPAAEFYRLFNPHLEKAVALQPRSAHLQTSLGLALLEQGRPDESVACFRKAVAAAPGYVPPARASRAPSTT